MYIVEPTPGMLVTPKLRLVRHLGSGGMGAVWLADHLALSTQVVVKFVSAELVWSKEAVARFSREASAASQVKSPHVVQMLDHGISDAGIPYIVMELLEGHDLSDHLTSAGIPPREVIPIISQLAHALSRAHERGIVHRDIKPSNVFLCDMGGGELFVKLLDFGVAKHEGSTKPGEETRTGALVGSPFYMSPEQLMGDKATDFRSDLWSLGVLAFEALTGQRPFTSETIGALTMQVHAEPRPRPTQKNPALPPAIDAWFAKACALDPAARFRGAKELAEALATALDEDAPRGISLETSRPRLDEKMSLADTAEAPSGDVSGSGDKARSGSGAQPAASAPPNAATGSAMSRTGSLRREASWRPMAIVGVIALGAGLVGSRLLGGGGGTPAPPVVAQAPSGTAAPGSTSASAASAPAPVTVAAVEIADAAAASVPPRATSAPAATKTTVPAAGPPRRPPPAPTASARPAPSSSAGKPAQGSDDDIR